MPNLEALSTAQITATNLANLILVTPDPIGYQPQNVITDSEDGTVPALPASFLFDFEGEQSLMLSSDITDHFIENNSAIQDQVALRPEIFTTHGFIGELNDVVPPALKTLKFAASKLTALTPYAPSLSITAQIAFNNARQVYQTARNVADNAVATWATLNGTNGVSIIDGNDIEIKQNQNKQQIAFQKFYGYWRTRTLFTIQTPWAIFKNMAIQNLRAVQDADTRMITDFEITFKLMRFADTVRTFTQGAQVDPTQFEGRAFTQGSPLINRGVVNTAPAGDLLSAIG